MPAISIPDDAPEDDASDEGIHTLFHSTAKQSSALSSILEQSPSVEKNREETDPVIGSFDALEIDTPVYFIYICFNIYIYIYIYLRSSLKAHLIIITAQQLEG